MEVQSVEFCKAQAHIWNQVFSFTTCASLKCAVQLGIADAIDDHGKPMSLFYLTKALQINPSKAPYIQRLMGILVNSGFFSQDKLSYYSLTPSSRLLLKKEELNLRGAVEIMLDPAELKAWSSLSDWFKDEKCRTTFEMAHGKNFWDFCAEESIHGEIFNRAMSTDSQLISKLLVTEYKFLFEGLTSLVDIGGGTGTIAKAIAKSFPKLKCTVFDLPHVVANLESKENLEFVGGDMFERIPNANAILLKIVLHNWNDEDCMKILKKCKEAILGKEKSGKVIIIDIVMDSKKEDYESLQAQISMDLQMMVLLDAKERREKEWAILFQKSGFSGYKIFSMFDYRSIIEVYP
ncbi:hypothetical protein M9H77_21095 [Catharanthus roseus]|uniref:Uncharacterized protein n=2 Tax=Catharanthus roseus TaxID=4058 RepID=A0ACC0AP41_CATRO|nr:putative O-methyltransferase [Catharanthus roseus]AAR02418.1 putative O-methyltransferase [Catharanthus roseus]KAI5661772.1 hypothetical protein M9H77_21095 [Catharanthus roseus]